MQALNDPEAYRVNVETGLWSPVPWYWWYFQAADRCNCSPWELIEGYGTDEGYTPRDFWVEAAIIVNDAEREHARFMQSRPANSQPGQGSKPL